MKPNGEDKCRGEGVGSLFRLSHPERAEPGRAQPSPDPPLNLPFPVFWWQFQAALHVSTALWFRDETLTVGLIIGEQLFVVCAGRAPYPLCDPGHVTPVASSTNVRVPSWGHCPQD